MFTVQEKKRAIQLGKKLGIEVSFGNKESGVFVGDSKVAEIEDMFPDLNAMEFTEVEREMHSTALKSISTVTGRRFENGKGEDETCL